MRMNIDIDDKLMNDALKATGLTSKKDVVELALKTLLMLHDQAQIRHVRGKPQTSSSPRTGLKT